MTRTRRKALLAGVVSLFATAVAVPMVVSGTAEAQSGSRLCGIFWSTVGKKVPGGAEVIVRIYEVPKSSSYLEVCAKANAPQGGPKEYPHFADAPEPGGIRKGVRNQSDALWEFETFGPVVCEAWTSRDQRFGGLQNKDLVIAGNTSLFPKKFDHGDICTGMKRSTFIQQMEPYWLYTEPDTLSKPIFIRKAIK